MSKVGVTQLSAAFDMEYGFTTYVGIDYNMVLRQWEIVKLEKIVTECGVRYVRKLNIEISILLS